MLYINKVLMLTFKSGLSIFFSFGTSANALALCQCRRHKRCRFDSWVRKITQRRKWQPTPVFLPGKSHGQRGLVGYSPWYCKELDTTAAT